MNTRFAYRVACLLVAFGLMAQSTAAQERKYTDYNRNSTRVLLLEIVYDNDRLELVALLEDSEQRVVVSRADLTFSEGRVGTTQTVLFDKAGVHVGESIIDLSLATDLRISDTEHETHLAFYSRTGSEARVSRIRSGNRIDLFGDILIPQGEFVRGFLFTLTGDIDIDGEVNKDVVSLFGDVHLGANAVVRGDVVTISGEMDATGHASIYGVVYEGEAGRRQKYRRRESSFGTGFNFDYDRVDGLALNLSGSYEDTDSLLPQIRVSAGYAFESELWRYEVSLEQNLLSSPRVTLGGQFYRRLATDDTYIVTSDENTVFALLAREDFRDYYEAEGGAISLKVEPWNYTTFDLGYTYEETNWLPAQRNLWSVFGGDKKFRSNFSSVELDARLIGAAEIDTTALAWLSTGVVYDSRNQDEPFSRSAWVAESRLELSHPDLNSDFDYRRYMVRLQRYQKIHPQSILMLRAIYGGSDGYLPMHRRFYLGGVSTLSGYVHKEFVGGRFWMGNAEYRIELGKSELATSLFWDVGQIANDQRLDSSVEVKHALGMAVYFGHAFQVSLAKRLDGRLEDSPLIHVRLSQQF